MSASATEPANPASTLPPLSARTLVDRDFITVSPMLTWPSPPRATRPSLRTARMVVPWNCHVHSVACERFDSVMSIAYARGCAWLYTFFSRSTLVWV